MQISSEAVVWLSPAELQQLKESLTEKITSRFHDRAEELIKFLVLLNENYLTGAEIEKLKKDKTLWLLRKVLTALEYPEWSLYRQKQ